MAISMRFLEKGETAIGQEYIHRLWKANNILARDKNLFEWQYASFDKDMPTGFMIAEDPGAHQNKIIRLFQKKHMPDILPL